MKKGEKQLLRKLIRKKSNYEKKKKKQLELKMKQLFLKLWCESYFTIE